MSTKQAAASSGIGFSGLLTIVFVIAKLWDRVDWSWWWVFAPMWVPVGVVLGVTAGVIAFGLFSRKPVKRGSR